MTANPTPPATAAAQAAADLAATEHLQAQASDPLASVWVSANAGTGKTQVLTRRVLRLLLTGTAPERILCLTYTKAAAAEMSTRVFDTLARWIGLDDEPLAAELSRLTTQAAGAAEIARARTLFTRAIETPGGLKVQTIHAFCERLLQRFPLEAGVSPGFEILDDATARELTREAIDATLTTANSGRDAPLAEALTAAIRYAADDHFDTVLTEAIRHGDLFDALIRGARDEPAGTDPLALARQLLQTEFRVDGAPAEAKAALAAVLDTATLQRLAGRLAEGSKSDIAAAADVRAAATSHGDQRIAALSRYFLTTAGEPRKKLMTNGVRDADPGLERQAVLAQSEFVEARHRLQASDCIAATLALYRLADAVLQRYRDAKAARAALDFDDLIVRTARLLDRPDGAAWVLYKLDGGLDHILVDEAQDTAPEQWRVISALAGEFFAGAGAERDAIVRTVFAVGDEKQSIYSFQGADPAMFSQMGAGFAARAAAIDMPWRPRALTLSFRSVAPVLNAVDRVFADPSRTPGIAVGKTEAIRHAVRRAGEAGLVEVWPPEVPDPKTDTDAWAPLDEPAASSPVTRLAQRIATTIGGWLDGGERLTSQDRAIRPGDILILVRKREPFAGAIVAALKAAGIAVAGADRMALLRQIAVMDLVALGDFLTLPEDDLSLACVLKSPLFGLDDDDLLTLAHGRKGTLWKALLDAAPAAAKFGRAATELKRWRKQADFVPPFEFYATVLDSDGGRARLLERLGPEAADGIDELLSLALTYDDSAPPSLTGFLQALRSDEHIVKRDMEQGRDEVRVLTVHGAKGLEAPIVFLPDTCATGSGRLPGGLLPLDGAARPSGVPRLLVWPIKGASALPTIADAKAKLQTSESEERDRLLYVAMTRPRDRLYIAGAQSREKLAPGCWYDVVTAALDPILVDVTLPDGATVRRIESAQTVPAVPRAGPGRPAAAAAPRPLWLSARAPREAQPAIPLAPSRFAPYDHDDTGEPSSQTPATSAGLAGEPAHAPPSAAAGYKFLRGTLTHALLEHLPAIAPAARAAAAEGFLARRAPDFPPSLRRAIAAETLAVLSNPGFTPLFTQASLAEVPIVAEIADPAGRRPPLRLHGQIDRLVETASEVLIVDYKTNRDPPTAAADVAVAYLVQLAAYRFALRDIFNGKPVRAALLWTQTPRLMEIPAELLDSYSSRLWELGTAALDGDGAST